MGAASLAALLVAAAVQLALATPAAAAPCGPNRWVPNRGRPDPIQAFFTRRSYPPGATARLAIRAAPPGLRVRLFRAGREAEPVRRRDTMGGAPLDATAPAKLGALTVRVGATWPSGLYFARLSAAGGAVAYAPFIVRAPPDARLRVAIVLPTNTWQAYNLLDADGNGYGDTWYADPRVDSVSLERPFFARGVPPHFGGFVHFAVHYDLRADFLSDDDLDAVPDARTLLARYDGIVFAGHEEYVTGHEFALVEGYRDLGGNLAFLSANSFYSHVERRGENLVCLGHFRDEGRPEASFVGVQYLDWSHGVYRNRPYVVVGAERAPWFFRGTGLRDGDTFGSSYGVEIDTLSPASPPGTHVVAELPNVFGPGRTAEMTYYETRRGARVFAAGAFNFESSQSAVTDRLLFNLWNRISRR